MPGSALTDYRGLNRITPVQRGEPGDDQGFPLLETFQDLGDIADTSPDLHRLLGGPVRFSGEYVALSSLLDAPASAGSLRLGIGGAGRTLGGEP